MRILLFTGIILLFCISCNDAKKSESQTAERANADEIQFDKSKWRSKEGHVYPYRDKMHSDLLYNDTVRMLNEQEILDLLGKPDRSNEGYFYYTVTQKRIGSWPLHTKSLVVKFTNDSTIEWIKIHK